MDLKGITRRGDADQEFTFKGYYPHQPGHSRDINDIISYYNLDDQGISYYKLDMEIILQL